MRATRSDRCRPYLATTGRSTSVTGLVGLAFRPTERLIGTKSSLEKKRTEMICPSLRSSTISGHSPYLSLHTTQNWSLYLNRVRFSSRRSREHSVIQSWSKTSGWTTERKLSHHDRCSPWTTVHADISKCQKRHTPRVKANKRSFCPLTHENAAACHLLKLRK